MSDTKLIDLDSLIYIELPVVDVASVSPVDEKQKILNYEIISLALEHIHTNNRPQFAFVMKGMQKMCNLYIEGFANINSKVKDLDYIINDILNPPVLTSPMGMSLIRNTGLGSLDSAIGNVSSGCDSVIGGCTGLANQFSAIGDSGDMTSFIKSMAEFLVCPELSFLNDIINGINNIVDEIKNFRPDQLLQDIIGKLSDFVEDIVSDVASTIMDLVNSTSDYLFAEGTMFGDLLDSIEMVLDMYNATWDMLMNTPVIGPMFRDLFDKKNANQNDLLNGWLGGGSNQTYPPIRYPDWETPVTRYPEPVETIRCKQLAKIAQQQEDSFRSNNRFDQLYIDQRMISGISDPAIAREIKDYSRYPDRMNSKLLSTENSRKLGYRGKTAYNSSLSSLMTITDKTRSTKRSLSRVNTEDELREVLVNTKTNNKMIHTAINEEMDKHVILLEGLKNIEKQNGYYDFNEVLV